MHKTVQSWWVTYRHPVYLPIACTLVVPSLASSKLNISVGELAGPPRPALPHATVDSPFTSARVHKRTRWLRPREYVAVSKVAPVTTRSPMLHALPPRAPPFPSASKVHRPLIVQNFETIFFYSNKPIWTHIYKSNKFAIVAQPLEFVSIFSIFNWTLCLFCFLLFLHFVQFIFRVNLTPSSVTPLSGSCFTRFCCRCTFCNVFLNSFG